MIDFIMGTIWYVGAFVVVVGIATAVAIAWEKASAKHKEGKKPQPSVQVTSIIRNEEPVEYKKPEIYTAPKQDDFCWCNPYVPGTVRYYDWEKRYGDKS